MLPVPAGGMTMARVPEMRDRFGTDTMLLIGGSLLVAREHLLERAREFVVAVREFGRKLMSESPVRPFAPAGDDFRWAAVDSTAL